MTEETPKNEFDFWVGEWDLTWGEDGKGTNVIEKVLDEAVVLEKFDGTPSIELRGMSVTTYSKEKACWAQTWVDTNGSYLDFTGGRDGDRMILSRDGVVKGEAVKQRMVWENISGESLDWHWQRSDDGGETWNTQWHIRYQRRK